MSLVLRDIGKRVMKTGLVRSIVNWARKSSLWAVLLFNGCCDVEYSAFLGPRYDAERFGFIPAFSARQADVLFVIGTVTKKLATRIRMIYDQMPEPKYVVAIGACAVSGGPFRGSPFVVEGLDKIVPVDVYVSGCPPRPEAMLQGLRLLQEKIAKGDVKI